MGFYYLLPLKKHASLVIIPWAVLIMKRQSASDSPKNAHNITVHNNFTRKTLRQELRWGRILSAALMGVAFCSTAAVYVDTDYSVTNQALSIIAVWCSLVFTALAYRETKSERAYFASFESNITIIMVVAAMTIFPLARVANFISAADQLYTIGYAVALFATLSIIIWHVWVCGVGHLIGGFVAASIIGPIGYLVLAYSQGNLAELTSIEKRFATDGMHPNLLGFCCAGFSCVTLCTFFISRNKWRGLLLIPSVISLVTIYLASSRGSIVGIIVGALSVSLVIIYRLLRAAMSGNFIAGVKLLALTLLVLVCTGTYVVAAERIFDSALLDAIAERLALFNEYRGLQSGLTGRIATWQWVFSQ